MRLVENGWLVQVALLAVSLVKVDGSEFRLQADGCAAATEIMSPPLARDRACTGPAAAVGSTVRSL